MFKLSPVLFILLIVLIGGNCRDLFYLNFESSYLMNGLTDWLDFLYGNIIWPGLLMCEVSRNLSKYNHPNQPTYPKISKKRSYKNIPRNFLKFCMNNHPTLGQILGKLYGDHVTTLAVIAKNIFFTLSKTQNSSTVFYLFTCHDYPEWLSVSGLVYKYYMFKISRRYLLPFRRYKHFT